ncbi:Uncharacterised protein [uncultured archaeon]|nr:Uncharacterised protein [uncultured archaeon]
MFEFIRKLMNLKGKDYFYIMHLSYGRNYKRELLWNYAKENKIIGLDLPNIVNGDWNKEKESARERGISGIWEKQFDIWYNDMGKGDIVMILAGWKSILGVAEIDDNYPEYNQEFSVKEKFFEHIRRVNWIKKYDFDEVPCQVKGFYNTLRKVERGSKWWTSLANIELP